MTVDAKYITYEVYPVSDIRLTPARFLLEAVPAGLIKISSARSVDSWIRSSIQGGRCFPQKPCFKSYSADAIMSAWKAKDKNLLRKLYDECDDFLRVYDAVSLQ